MQTFADSLRCPEKFHPTGVGFRPKRHPHSQRLLLTGGVGVQLIIPPGPLPSHNNQITSKRYQFRPSEAGQSGSSGSNYVRLEARVGLLHCNRPSGGHTKRLNRVPNRKPCLDTQGVLGGDLAPQRAQHSIRNGGSTEDDHLHGYPSSSKRHKKRKPVCMSCYPQSMGRIWGYEISL